MPDTQNFNVSKKDFASYFIACQRANLIKNGLENETAPFLPKDIRTRTAADGGITFVGQLSPQPIFHATSGMPLDAKEMIPAILLKTERGFESNVVGSYGTMKKAQTAIKKGEKGVGHLFQGKDKQNHSANYYFPEQTKQPELLQDYAQKNMKWEQRLSNETFQITSPEIEEYLGTYVAACRSGANVEVSSDIATQFKEKMLAVCDNELKRTSAVRDPAIPKMSDLLFNANIKAVEICKNREKELGIGQEQKQKPQEHERNQSVER